MVSKAFKTWCIGLTIFSSHLWAANLVDTSVSSENFSVDAVLKFDEAVSEKDVKVNFINQTIQIDVPKVSVPEGKSRVSLSSEKIRSLYTYQLNDSTMRTRIIYEKPARADRFEGFVHVSAVGNQLKIRVEDPESTMSTAKVKSTKLQLTPPIDLDSELKPKEFKKQKVNTELSAAAVLEDEFLSKIEKYDEEIAQLAKGRVQPEPVEQPEKKTSKEDSKETSKKSSLKESEIPLSLGSKEKKAQVETPWMRLIVSFAVISLLGIGTIIFTKKFSRSKEKIGGNIQIQTVSQKSLGPKKSLAVIRVAGEDILVGITDYNISMIKSLSFIDDETSDVPTEFVSELDRVTDGFISEKTKARSSAIPSRDPRPARENQEQYSYANIKDLVSDKLKEMRTL